MQETNKKQAAKLAWLYILALKMEAVFPPKHKWTCAGPHGVTSQKVILFIIL
jgi:hypothetical protein